jgi:glycosyltransferase involved in cell wall biosynthesis
MMTDFTVAICTYNGARRLPALLNGLRAQSLGTAITWEVIVIDNNSTDATPELIHQMQTDWRSDVPLRYSLEPRQGLGFARQRAVELATGTLVGFLDDDNIPASDWVEQAYQFGQAHPQAAVYAGKIHGLYEVPPPPNFELISRFLAVGGAAHAFCYNHGSDYALPPGAGAVVRRTAWLSCVPEVLQLQGRIGGLRLPGEDLEAFMHLRQAGWEAWYTPDLVIHHQIPKERLEASYLLDLMWRVGLSRHYTRTVGLHPAHQALMTPLFLLNDGMKVIAHSINNLGGQQQLVDRCQGKLLVGSALSPFHYWLHRVLGMNFWPRSDHGLLFNPFNYFFAKT